MSNILEEHQKAIEDAIPDIITELTVDARIFFDESWDNKGFTDDDLVTWEPVIDRKTKEVKESPLVDTGALRRSLRTESNGDSGTVYTEQDYASYHNEGSDIHPQRQFMGESAELDSRALEIIENKISEILGL